MRNEESKARAWREDVVIPTYETGKPEKNPIFLEKRVYQGSSGVVYPYPVIESIADEKHDKTYHAVFLENEYIKVMVLPELGGRIQMAFDKVRQRHFIYYNRVIKPALVGLAGPWISGGIEFNWPQHHRPSTFMPVDCKIEENADGSVTVWVNERERMFHQKGMAGFTLRPGCAYLEIKGVVYNPTETPQTFLWWANPAVSVNNHYQSVFPPDVNAVFDHGKRAVSTFPIATGVYYKMDYSAGVDISNYKNIFVPTSYMVAKSKYDFEGGYENDTRAGMLHVADHHVSPGKKQWTWGNGDFGRAWDRNLTDDDGPYIELMAGVFTENQPDFSWLMPYEEKSFTQYFMPYRELGIVKNASRDFIINITSDRLMVFATSHQKVQVQVRHDNGQMLFDRTVELSPEQILTEPLTLTDDDLKAVTLQLIQNGRTVLAWHAGPVDTSIPDPAMASLPPEQVKTNDQLYMTGLHLEQYRHATWSALDYYEEALRRDPLDIRCNNAIGLWYLRRGRWEKAEPHLRTAVSMLQQRNLNPYDGEPLYNLGLCLKYQGKYDEAYDWFYKSTWNRAWQDAGYLACAQISTMRGNYAQALEEVEHSLIYGWHNHKARALKAALLRLLGCINDDSAQHFCAESLTIDPFNYGILYEQKRYDEMQTLMHHNANNYDELALDYVAAGLYDDAVNLWRMAIEQGAATPMTYYYTAWITQQQSDLQAAHSQPQDYCFPNRLEAVQALSGFTDDSRALYYLGNLYYDKRQYDLALTLWERSAALEPQFPTVHRNLALIYFNKVNRQADALREMQTAFSLDTSDARILMEYDQLCKRLQHPHTERLQRLQQYEQLVIQRDDLLLEYITLLNLTGQYAEARQRLDSHIFHPWEGGEGKVPEQYQLARIGMAMNLPEGTDRAQWLRENGISLYPHHLGEGRLYCAQENDIQYLLRDFEAGTAGPTEPAPAMYYNDASPDKIYYAGLCYRELGDNENAERLFNALVQFGKAHIDDHIRMDYFAVSLPDLQIWEADLDQKNRIHCNFMMALGYAGLHQHQLSQHHLALAQQEDINHIGIHKFLIITKGTAE
ncbi:MAG: DUF5107 domain-containing protein [Prevotellaceae bacterium]|nr:DUF5107 domain-containing protein [Candidatus Colivivens caballi]